DFLCDDIGLDIMNTGVALAVAMDAGVISFSDTQAAIDMVRSVARGTKMGRLIGNGPDAVGRHYETIPYTEDDLHGTFAAIRQLLEERR
ncbi:MAG: hypothetical protein GY774_30240, partial [Planctomycetes bacterium]|nr:hypothetical protein [Planctomycetota bacterium]